MYASGIRQAFNGFWFRIVLEQSVQAGTENRWMSKP